MTIVKSSSIKRFLLINLLLSITVISSLTAIGNYFLDHRYVKQELDKYLTHTAAFLEMVLSKEVVEQHRALTAVKPKIFTELSTVQSLQFEIFDRKGKTLVDSNPQFRIAFKETPIGLSDQKIYDSYWRVYKKVLPELDVTVAVGESSALRSKLERELVWDNMITLLWVYPILGFLVWITINMGLASVRKITQNILNRPPDNFEAIQIKKIPIEIQPLIQALNNLFLKLFQEFERKKRFASDAAHELRTPLAALKTQTQVAMLAKSNEERQIGFEKILTGVDRCTHIVKQLLMLSRLTNQDVLENFKVVNLYSVLSEMLALLAPVALEKNIEIELLPSDEKALVYGNETILGVLMRNLIDNAIRYAPEGSKVEAQIISNPTQKILIVSDNGPGIPPELHERVFERFYRVLGTKAAGSGLGMPIVKQIAELHYATVTLGKPKTHSGLEVKIAFPAHYCHLKHAPQND